MKVTRYRNRRAVQFESDQVRVTVLAEGGHVAEMLHKATGINPLWTPPWPSIEPSEYEPAKHPEYGRTAESRLLAGIMGHNICLDIFGGPSREEAAAGLDVHGEAATAPYEFEELDGGLVMRTELPEAGLRFERTIRLAGNGWVAQFSETVENLRATDRPVGWTQHVTLGPPFLENGVTQFRAPGTRSKVYEEEFAGEKGLQKAGAEFVWPQAPLKDGRSDDLQVFTAAPVSGGFTATLMDPARAQAFFVAWSPKSKVLIGYVWGQKDYPWLGRWEENRSREAPPWNGRTVALGMEFGVSPMPETRRQMLERGSLFGVPGYRWIPARSKVRVEYCAFVATAASIPEEVRWDGAGEVSW